MIKVKLSIDENKVNGFNIELRNSKIEVWKYGAGVLNHLHLYTCDTIEEAVKFCLEH